MSGADGPLIGEAIMSDGDVLSLSIEQGSEGTQRPFVLFAAAHLKSLSGNLRGGVPPLGFLGAFP